jgi:hypothetical protein
MLSSNDDEIFTLHLISNPRLWLMKEDKEQSELSEPSEPSGLRYTAQEFVGITEYKIFYDAVLIRTYQISDEREVVPN